MPPSRRQRLGSLRRHLPGRATPPPGGGLLPLAFPSGGSSPGCPPIRRPNPRTTGCPRRRTSLPGRRTLPPTFAPAPGWSPRGSPRSSTPRWSQPASKSNQPRSNKCKQEVASSFTSGLERTI
ncbi:hypothetical protein GQ55_4G100900 [Panicum hallii var. hallii]|uniref:Uncharacterized protein n=2 Tax=Panicum hallii TaxID=206008 RepID=A0A2T7DX58_9POAL|nr:hypothetical protein GQ55_4G100900 [Panicum hallii var. hallii]PVH47603.1 hypothetical protein PAHAL_4G100200 [Panicum hallii]